MRIIIHATRRKLPMTEHPDIPKLESLTVAFAVAPHDAAVVESAVALANAQGGTIFVGVDAGGRAVCLQVSGGQTLPQVLDDCLRRIARSSVPPVGVRGDLLQAGGKPVLVLHVGRAHGIAALADGRVLRRKVLSGGLAANVPMFPAEQWVRLSDLGLLDVTAQPVFEAACTDLDPAERNRLRDLVRRYGVEKQLPDLADADFDRALGLVQEAGGRLVPTVAGLLMAGRRDRLAGFVPNARVVLTAVAGTAVRGHEEFVLPVAAALEEIEKRLAPFNPEREFSDGLFRVGVPEFSRTAIREALVNAMAHRDFARPGAIRVTVDDEGLTIANPGGFAGGVAAARFLQDAAGGGLSGTGRNRLLGAIVRRIGLGDTAAGGVQRICEGSLVYARPCPDWSQSTEETVRLFIARGRVDFAHWQRVRDWRRDRTLSLADLMILAALAGGECLTTGELAARCPADRARLEVALGKLVAAGLVACAVRGGRRLFGLHAAACKSGPATVPGSGKPPEEAIIDVVKNAGCIRRRDVMELLGVNGARACRLLQNLVRDGRLELVGERRGSRYVLAGKEQK